MLKEIELRNIELNDNFWKEMQNKVKKITLPYQFSVLNDEVEVNVEAERKDDSLPSGKSHAIENLRIAAGITQGDHFGWVFQDTDVYKWIESVAYFLMFDRDNQLERSVDEVVDIIEKAQEADGYLNTYYQCKTPQLKYRELHRSHELYCAGHLIEAAIAYDKATGKKKLLNVAKKFVENIQSNFGWEKEKLKLADGHQEIELALVKLYEHTNDREYLDLAEFFIDIRGENYNAYQEEVNSLYADGMADTIPKIDPSYHQAHEKPVNQKQAVGHAVRLLYMTIGMVKIVQHNTQPPLYDACLALWNNIIKYKMYITGGVGSTVHGEAFTGDYDLPNDTMYCETCASIALINFALELYKLEPTVEYLKVIENALYNTIIASVSTDGKQFFYVNPLETNPTSCHTNPGKGHVKLRRPDWLGCACCPPNFTRTMGALGKFIASYDEKINYLNLLIPSKINYPSGKLELTSNDQFTQFQVSYKGNPTELKIYMPDWLSDTKIEVTKGTYLGIENGFMVFTIDEGELYASISGNVEPFAIVANPHVVSDAHKVAIQKGPYIYCAEEVDNEKSLHRHLIKLSSISEATENNASEFKHLKLKTKKLNEWNQEQLYERVGSSPVYENSSILMVPYHLWGNRGENEMKVWFNYSD